MQVPALALANVGFAIGTGTNVAIESADITLMRGSLNGVADAIEISRATLRNIRQNLFGAFVYNAAVIPFAACVLYPVIGVLLNPIIAGAAQFSIDTDFWQYSFNASYTPMDDWFEIVNPPLVN